MRINILFISPIAPFDRIGHAGGKTHNYYLKRFAEDADCNVRLLAFAKLNEIDKVDCNRYHIMNEVFQTDGNKSIVLKRILYDGFARFNVFDKYAGMKSSYKKYIIKKTLKKYKRQGYYPDVIIFEWTEFALFIDEAKNIYPNSVFVASEHDVTFLGSMRRYQEEKKFLKKSILELKYKHIHSAELIALAKYDLILPHNIKDRDLLVREGLDEKQVSYIDPYFDNYSSITNSFTSKNIIFFGDMRREENYSACIWFIENVFHNLLEIDNSFKFLILGGNPDPILKKYASQNVIITGFVKDLDPYFSDALCMAAPLKLGAGIKVKILEAMSAGIPVLTNSIGIEGIPSKDKEEYYFCESPQDYLQNILELSSREAKAIEISNACKKFINENFNLEKSFQKYKSEIKKVSRILNEKRS